MVDNMIGQSEEMWPQRVKEMAYSLDPECWISYSGKPKRFKQYMEGRRLSSLIRAKSLTAAIE
jgi:hypothetical protein